VAKKVDLIVLDQNVLDVDPNMISETKVPLTMMNGIIRQRDGL